MKPKVLCLSQLLLVNKYSEIMGATEATIYLFMDKEQRWLTPALTSGGRNSATRQYALQHELCVEATIELAQLECHSMCWLSDGARGFYPGYLFPSVLGPVPEMEAEHTSENGQLEEPFRACREPPSRCAIEADLAQAQPVTTTRESVEGREGGERMDEEGSTQESMADGGGGLYESGVEYQSSSDAGSVQAVTDSMSAEDGDDVVELAADYISQLKHAKTVGDDSESDRHQSSSGHGSYVPKASRLGRRLRRKSKKGYEMLTHILF